MSNVFCSTINNPALVIRSPFIPLFYIFHLSFVRLESVFLQLTTTKKISLSGFHLLSSKNLTHFIFLLCLRLEVTHNLMLSSMSKYFRVSIIFEFHKHSTFHDAVWLRIGKESWFVSGFMRLSFPILFNQAKYISEPFSLSFFPHHNFLNETIVGSG